MAKCPASSQVRITYKVGLLTVAQSIEHGHWMCFMLQEAGEVFGSFGWSNAPISARYIRYVGLPRSGNELPKNYGDVVVLSFWNAQRNIVNVYTLTENAKSSMLLANAITRVIYETFSKSAIRTNKFYRVLEGPIDVAFCPSDELEKRDVLKQKKEADKILDRECTSFDSFVCA
jgi:hypothetical protein